MFISDRFPDAVREEKQEGVLPPSVEGSGAE
jgi:hypothetical protein